MVTIGTTDDNQPVTITDRLTGTYIVGKSGMGKSSLMLSMILEDIREGHGVAVFDPHGKLIDEIIERLPGSRSADTLIWDMGNESIIPALDIFSFQRRLSVQVQANFQDSVTAAFRKTVGGMWGPRIEALMQAIAMTFLDYPGWTLLEMELMLDPENPAFRRHVMGKLTNQDALRFWKSFDDRTTASKNEYIESTLTRIRPFIFDPFLKVVFGQQGKTLDWRRMMDEERIVLVSLRGENPKHKKLLATIMFDRLLAAAYSRKSDTPHFYIYIDEFQWIASDEFSGFFTDARKFGVGITVAHQDRLQMGDFADIPRKAANHVIFKTEPEDARILGRLMPQPEMPYTYSFYAEQENPFVGVLKTHQENRPAVPKLNILTAWDDVINQGHPDADVLRTAVRAKGALETFSREAATWCRESGFPEGMVKGLAGELTAAVNSFLLCLGHADREAWGEHFSYLQRDIDGTGQVWVKMVTQASTDGRRIPAFPYRAGTAFIREIETLGKTYTAYYEGETTHWEREQGRLMREHDTFDETEDEEELNLPEVFAGLPELRFYARTTTQNAVQARFGTRITPPKAVRSLTHPTVQAWMRKASLAVGLPLQAIYEQIDKRQAPFRHSGDGEVFFDEPKPRKVQRGPI